MKTHRRMTILLLVSMMLQTVMADSSITCFQDNLKCEMTNGNLIETYVGTTWQECSLLCEDELTCLSFNYTLATSIRTMPASCSRSAKVRFPPRIVS